MNAPPLRLSAEDLRRVVGDVDAVHSVAAALVARSGGHPDWTAPEAGNVTPADGGELVEYRPVHGGLGLSIPAAGLRAYRRAVLTALAARNLLAPGVVTASVVGRGLALDFQLTALCAHVPDVSHVAVATTGTSRASEEVVDLLDCNGIGMAAVDRPADALFGATLVVLADPATLGTPRLVKGAVLVNTAGVDLPAPVLDCVHAVFVDHPDPRAHNNQSFAETRPAGRRGHGRGKPPAVAADLGRVLAGEHPGRTEPDQVLLVELVGDDVGVDAILAGRLYRAALAADRGRLTRNHIS